MARNVLVNGDFEVDWGDERSHRCLVLPKSGDPQDKDVGNIFTPLGWVTWFRHDPGKWDQPEVRDAWKTVDPHRVHSGDKAVLLFTFYRRHDAGFLQQVEVTTGARLRLTAWAHAWSNHPLEGHEACTDNGRCSCGVGKGPAFILEGDAPEQGGDPWNDAIANFTFCVGIDPAGGMDPRGDTVVWGRGAHIYNDHAQVPPVEAVAESETVTVFLRSKTLWAFKHCDAYWDDAELVVVGEEEVPPEVQLSHEPASPTVGGAVTLEARSTDDLGDVRLILRRPSGTELALDEAVVGLDEGWNTWTYTTPPLDEAGEYVYVFTAAGGIEETASFDCATAPTVNPPEEVQRGAPRQEYPRTYVLLPPDADADWALAAIDGVWDAQRYTVGSSADDAGIGDLDVRRVVAVNPEKWPTDLETFFNEHYPGVEYLAVEAESPDELVGKLKEL